MIPGRNMSEQAIVFHWKITALIKPSDGQECLVYNPCDGYRIAEWDEDDVCFYEQTPYQPISDHLAVFWMELPDTRAMCEMEQRIACQVVSVSQVTAREKPPILQETA